MGTPPNLSSNRRSNSTPLGAGFIGAVLGAEDSSRGSLGGIGLPGSPWPLLEVGVSSKGPQIERGLCVCHGLKSPS